MTADVGASDGAERAAARQRRLGEDFYRDPNGRLVYRWSEDRCILCPDESCHSAEADTARQRDEYRIALANLVTNAERFRHFDPSITASLDRAKAALNQPWAAHVEGDGRTERLRFQGDEA